MQTLINGYYVACGMDDGSISIFDSSTNSIKKNMQAHSLRVRSLALLSDNLASGSDDLNVKLWNTTTFGLIATLEPYSNKVLALAYLNNGNLAVASGTTIYIMDHLYLVASFDAFNVVFSLKLLQNGNLVSGSDCGCIRVWDVSNMTQVDDFSVSDTTAYPFAVLKSGYLVAGLINGTIGIWDAVLKIEINILNWAHRDNINSFIVLSNGYLASGSSDTTVRIWNFT